jgi:hypothetical protein
MAYVQPSQRIQYTLKFTVSICQWSRYRGIDIIINIPTRYQLPLNNNKVDENSRKSLKLTVSECNSVISTIRLVDLFKSNVYEVKLDPFVEKQNGNYINSILISLPNYKNLGRRHQYTISEDTQLTSAAMEKVLNAIEKVISYTHTNTTLTQEIQKILEAIKVACELQTKEECELQKKDDNEPPRHVITPIRSELMQRSPGEDDEDGEGNNTHNMPGSIGMMGH